MPAPSSEADPATLPAGGAGAVAGAGQGFAPGPELYAEMRRIARRLLGRDRQRGAIDPTELAHDAIIRLIQSRAAPAGDPGHALALGARAMRHVLIDEARRAGAAKRHMPTLLPTVLMPGPAPIGVDALDAALRALAEVSPDHAAIVELRFSLGLTIEEAAAALGVSERTVKRRWQSARAWLHDQLSDEPDALPGA